MTSSPPLAIAGLKPCSAPTNMQSSCLTVYELDYAWPFHGTNSMIQLLSLWNCKHPRHYAMILNVMPCHLRHGDTNFHKKFRNEGWSVINMHLCKEPGSCWPFQELHPQRARGQHDPLVCYRWRCQSSTWLWPSLESSLLYFHPVNHFICEYKPTIKRPGKLNTFNP